MDEIELVSERIVSGSVKTWSVAISEKTVVMISDGISNGILMRNAICRSDAPSIEADS